MGHAYADWCEFNGFEYNPQSYNRETGLPYVPLEKEIDQLIGVFTHSKYGTLLQLLKETGFRPIEAMRLRPRDFNLERQIITPNNPGKDHKVGCFCIKRAKRRIFWLLLVWLIPCQLVATLSSYGLGVYLAPRAELPVAPSFLETEQDMKISALSLE